MVRKQSKIWQFAKKFLVFVGALAFLVGLYIWSVPFEHTSAKPSAYPAIDEFIKSKAFTLKLLRPQVSNTILPGATSAPVIGKVYTTDPVVFITIDDGASDDLQAFYMMYKRGAVASLFLNDANIKGHYDFFKYWQQFGSTIQNHTINHLHLNGLPHDQQKHEICGNADLLQAEYGKRATLFRSPYGEANDAVNNTIAECNMKANIWWSVIVEDGKITYQRPNTKLQNGDIILLHFTPHLHSDLQVLFDQIDKQHLQIGKLEDWVH